MLEGREPVTPAITTEYNMTITPWTILAAIAVAFALEIILSLLLFQRRHTHDTDEAGSDADEPIPRERE